MLWRKEKVGKKKGKNAVVVMGRVVIEQRSRKLIT